MHPGRLQVICRCAGLWLLLHIPAAWAQTPAPLDIPNIPAGSPGSVLAAARQPNGGLIIGGTFTMIDGIPRRHLARLTADGTLDRDWNPSANGDVTTLAVNAAGDVYAGGYFTAVDGQTRHLVAKLSGTGQGTLDPYWNPRFVLDGASPAPGVLSLALDASGAVFAGGDFHQVGGLQRDFLVKLDGKGVGAADANWNPAVATAVTALVVDPNGALYVARQPPADDTGIPAIARCEVLCIEKYETTGPGAASPDWTPSVAGTVSALALDADGSLYAAGSFSTGAQLVRFARDGHGAVDETWIPPPEISAMALALDEAGDLYVAHYDGVTKLATRQSGAIVAAWNSSANKSAQIIALGPDSTAYVGGFRMWEEEPTFGLARLSTADGSELATVEAAISGKVRAIARQPNGGTIVAGDFLRAGAVRRRNLFRIAADGSLDADWNPSSRYPVHALAVAGDNSVYVALSADRGAAVAKLAGAGIAQVDPHWRSPLAEGSVTALTLDEQASVLYVGGLYAAIDGVAARNIVRISAHDGTLDTAWSASMDGFVLAMVLDGSGALYAGSYPDALEQPSLAKLSVASGAADPHWHPAMPPGQTWALALASDGSLYAGGSYYPDHPYNHPPDRYLVKIGRDGIVDGRWNPPRNTEAISRWVSALAVDANDTVYAGGGLSAGTASRGFLEKLFDTGTAIEEWRPVNDGNEVLVLTLDADTLLLGGDFSTVGAQPRDGLAALPLDLRVQRAHSQRPLPRPLRERSNVRQR